MALGLRVTVMRSLMAVLAPLTGTRATGTALVKSTTGGDVVLPAGCHAAPIVASDTGNKQIARDKLVFSAAQVTVNPAGVAVPVRSLLGGVRHNFDDATELRWDPQLTGIELVSVLSGAMTGGLEPTGDAMVRRILAYEDLSTAQVAAQLFAAKMQSLTPTLIITWAGTGPSERMGRSVWQRSDRWVVYVVVTRKDGTIERGHQGLNLLDLVEAYLGERGAVDGANFSDPPVTITGASRHSVTPSSYVYALSLETHNAVDRIDTRVADGQFADWVRTSYDVSVAETPPYPLVVDARYDQ